MIRLRFYGGLALLVTALKGVAWWLDATPLLFFGDSVTYLEAAAHGYLPICRSFTYPWLLEVLALPPGSLALLVLAQTAAGAATAWLLGAALFRYGRVRERLLPSPSPFSMTTVRPTPMATACRMPGKAPTG